LRNESWDLLYYAIALSQSRTIRAETIDWDEPPTWAEEWDSNDMIYLPKQGEAKPFVEEVGDEYDMDEIADALL
jgi:hypothetical protein